jgi:hypothetical protein
MGGRAAGLGSVILLVKIPVESRELIPAQNQPSPECLQKACSVTQQLGVRSKNSQ